MGNLFLLAFVFIRDKILSVHFLSLACKIFLCFVSMFKTFFFCESFARFFFVLFFEGVFAPTNPSSPAHLKYNRFFLFRPFRRLSLSV